MFTVNLCVPPYIVSTFCANHFNKTTLAAAQHYELQRDAIKRSGATSQLDALGALVGVRADLKK